MSNTAAEHSTPDVNQQITKFQTTKNKLQINPNNQTKMTETGVIVI